MRRQRLDDMAAFCVAFHWTPTEYYRITVAEREAIIRAQNKANKK